MTTRDLPGIRTLLPPNLPRVKPKQRRFAERYAVHFDPGKAVIEAGYKVHNGNAIELSAILLAAPNVRIWIQTYMDLISQACVEIDGPRIRNELQKMALCKVADFYESREVVVKDKEGNAVLHEDGTPYTETKFALKDFTQMDTRGLKSIKLVENNHGQQVHLEAFDQKDALVKLGRAKGEFLEDVVRPIAVNFYFGMDQAPKVKQVIDITPAVEGER